MALLLVETLTRRRMIYRIDDCVEESEPQLRDIVLARRPTRPSGAVGAPLRVLLALILICFIGLIIVIS